MAEHDGWCPCPVLRAQAEIERLADVYLTNAVCTSQGPGPGHKRFRDRGRLLRGDEISHLRQRAARGCPGRAGRCSTGPRQPA
jgi:hypothetical protein